MWLIVGLLSVNAKCLVVRSSGLVPSERSCLCYAYVATGQVDMGRRGRASWGYQPCSACIYTKDSVQTSENSESFLQACERAIGQWPERMSQREAREVIRRRIVNDS